MRNFFYFIAVALMAVSCSSFEVSEQVSNDVAATKSGLTGSLTGSIWGQSTGCLRVFLNEDYSYSRMELYCIYFVFTGDTTGYAFYGNDVRMEGYKAVPKWGVTFRFTYKLTEEGVEMSELVMPDVRMYYKADGEIYSDQHIILGEMYYDDGCLMMATDGDNVLKDLQLISRDFDLESMEVPEFDWLDEDRVVTKAEINVEDWRDVYEVVEL